MDNPQDGGTCNAENLRAFLLGSLEEIDSDRIEQSLFADEEFFHEVQRAEDDLIDEYALGTLPESGRNYLKQRGERQPEFARRLAMRQVFFTALNGTPQRATKFAAKRFSGNLLWRVKQSIFLIPGLTVAAASLLIFCALLLRENLSLRSRVAQIEQRQESANLRMAQSVPTAATTPTSIAKLFFPEHLSRGAEKHVSRQIKALPSRLVELQFETPAVATSLRLWSLSISNKRGTLIHESGLHTQQIGSVSFVRTYIDTATLDPGNYEVILSSAIGSKSNYSRQWSFLVTK